VGDKRLRCAVYTRKSTEDGLEQEFNSLDAQYEACAAYAVSQRHEGWVLNPDRYDDGGFSGGSMERPGLKRLMADVAAGKVDIILLYKIDRLTRSLADFAKIVEVLDKAGASFVSITQSFNTTTSMGRLTLNMLLSFAQFEREVTGERIRDKIAASKRRGMWMGGSVPTGYLVKDRKLIVNEPQAEVVRNIMQRYLEVGSVVELVDDLARGGNRTEIKTSANGKSSGGVPFSRGMLYRLLSNPVYRGMMMHKGQAHRGEHEAIVSQELWDKVQSALAERTQGHARRMKAKDPSLLVGLLVDGDGRKMTASHTVKGKVRYRYYNTRPELACDSPAWRVSAHDLERIVTQRLVDLLSDKHELSGAVGKMVVDAQATATLFVTADHTAAVLQERSPAARLRVIPKLVERVELRSDQVTIMIDPVRLLDALQVPFANDARADPITLRCPATKVWHGPQLRLVIPGANDTISYRYRSPGLVRLMVEVHEARQLVLSDTGETISSIARKTGRCRGRLNELLRLTCLSPDIVRAILEGRQPIGLSNTALLTTPLPLDWQEQKSLLGFA
jgi:site-specific DNA recombinase